MIKLSWTKLTSRHPEYTLPRTVRVILFLRRHEKFLPNRCPAIDFSVSILCSGKVCLASRWLRVDFCSGSTILAFWRYFKIYSLYNENNLIAYIIIPAETHLSHSACMPNFICMNLQFITQLFNNCTMKPWDLLNYAYLKVRKLRKSVSSRCVAVNSAVFNSFTCWHCWTMRPCLWRSEIEVG
jgi:hypothetical protein